MAQAVGSADATTEAPLLLSSTEGTPPPLLAGAPRRNGFAFVCATLASVTTMLHGYSTYTYVRRCCKLPPSMEAFYYITKRC